MTIQENDAGQTVEKYLRKAFRQLPASLMHKAIRNKKIKVNRKRCQPKQLLACGDRLQLFLPPDVLEPADFVPNHRPLQTVWENRDLIVLYKPAGLLSQKDQPGVQDDLNSRLQTMLRERGDWDPDKDRSFRPAAAHRLDRNTSGLVLAGKTARGAREAARLIQEGRLEKHYHALVQGNVEKPEKLRLWLKKDGTRALVSDKPGEGFQEARMEVTPLKRERDLTLCDVNLETGRFHQIRAMMAFTGHPLEGDVKYGGRPGNPYYLEAFRLCLDGECIDLNDHPEVDRRDTEGRILSPWAQVK